MFRPLSLPSPSLLRPDQDGHKRPEHHVKDSRIKATIVASTRNKVTIGFVKIAKESSICRGFIWHLHYTVTGSRDAIRLDRQKAD